MGGAVMPISKVAAKGVAGCVVLWLSTLSVDAAAYCRTSTEGLKEGCRPAGSECCTAGVPVYWPNACIGWSIDTTPTVKRNISVAAAENTIAGAFDLWTNARCPGGESTSRVSINAIKLPPVDCDEAATHLAAPNQNVFMFRDSVWNHRDPDNVVALTTVSFDKRTGVIRGADTEFNSANINLVCPQPSDGAPDCFGAPPAPKAFDFASVVVHEVGHFLGFAHSNSDKATMAAQYANGEYTLRTLTMDDITAVCGAYPPDGTRTTGEAEKTKVQAGPCDATPLNGFTKKCEQDKCSGFCCSVESRRAVGSSGGAIVISLLAACAALRRRKRAKR
jgi:hypothetical protein